MQGIHVAPRAAHAGEAVAHQPQRGFWTYGYGLFHVGVDSSDILILVYAAVLGAGPMMGSMVDLAGSIGSILGLLLAGRACDRFGMRKWLLVPALAAPAVVLVAMVGTADVWVLMGLSFAWGIVMVGPVPMSSVVIRYMFRRNDWTDQQVRVSTFNTFGNTAGLISAIVCLAVLGYFWGDARAIRGFFLIAAAVSVCAGVAGWFGLSILRRPTHDSSVGHIRRRPLLGVAAQGPDGRPLSELSTHVTEPYNDRLKSLYLVTLVLHMGLGMAATLMPLYMVRGLHAKSYQAMAPSMVAALSATILLPLIGKLMARPLSLRIYSLAIMLRGALYIAIGAASIFLPDTQAIILVIVLMAGVGMCTAATSVSASTRLVHLLPTRQAGAAAGQYSATTFVALALGAVLGGMIAQWFGFFPAFCIIALWLFGASVLALRI